MGLMSFLLGKENKKEKPVSIEQEVIKSLANEARKQGDWYNEFYYSNKAIVDLYDNQSVSFRVSASNAEDDEIRLQHLYNCKNTLDEFREWCCQRKNGDRFYKKHDSIISHGEKASYYGRLLKDISDLEYEFNTVIPAILTCDGTLQSEFVKCFSTDGARIRSLIAKMEKEGYIRREKQGKSYLIYRTGKKYEKNLF